MSGEELEKLMAEYEQYRGSVPSRSSKQESSGGSERRVPIRPRESMKDILYNGVGVGEALPRVLPLICSAIVQTTSPRATTIPAETDLIFTHYSTSFTA